MVTPEDLGSRVNGTVDDSSTDSSNGSSSGGGGGGGLPGWAKVGCSDSIAWVRSLAILVVVLEILAVALAAHQCGRSRRNSASTTTAHNGCFRSPSSVTLQAVIAIAVILVVVLAVALGIVLARRGTGHNRGFLGVLPGRVSDQQLSTWHLSSMDWPLSVRVAVQPHL